MIERTEYMRLNRLLGLDGKFDSILSSRLEYRYFSIKRPDKDHISFIPKKDFTQLKNAVFLLSVLGKDVHASLLLTTKPRTFNIKHRKSILSYVFADWILALQHIRSHENEQHEKLMDYLLMETDGTLSINKIYHRNGTSESRSTIFTTNKYSVIICVNNMKKTRNDELLTPKNIQLIKENPLISFMEICEGFDNEKLNIFLAEIQNYSNKIFVKHKDEIDDRKRFSLKIRKIKRTNKNGMFIVKQNTILLDPRHVDSFAHELGHWYHTWFRKDIKTEKDAEVFAERFKEDYLS